MPRFRYDENLFYEDSPTFWPGPDDVEAFHRTLPGFAPTPLRSLPALARELGVAELWVKDEATRLGLAAFKVLGASYAIHRHRLHHGSGPTTFASATDGNHGRAVAWSARRLGQKAVIYVPRGTVAARIDAIRAEGAQVIVVEGTYDDAVRRSAKEAAENGWTVVSDTSWAGYKEIPQWIMEGYTTLFREVKRQLAGAEPTHVVLQAGVGAFAGAGGLFYAREGRRPVLVCVEPVEADGLRASVAAPGGIRRLPAGSQRSIMAGLNCGMPSLLAWPVIRGSFRGFLAIDDEYARAAMRGLAAEGVVSGESGAAGVAGLLAFAGEPELAAARAKLGLDAGARVLAVSTEGATDPAGWRAIVGTEPPVAG